VIRRGWRAPPPAVLVAAIAFLAFIATAIYAVPLDRFNVMPDELTYSKEALEIWSSPPLVGQGSPWFNSWSQLLPLVYSVPLGAFADLVDGVRVAHLVGAAVMALTAVPAYLLAAEVTGDRRAGYLVAALCVSVPWMAFAGTLMTEVFAYPAFTWAAWAAVRACAQPSPRHDAHALVAALVAVFARTQLVFVPIALVLAVAACVLRDRRGLGTHRVLVAAVGIGAVAVLLRIAFGGGLASTLGAYSSLSDAHSASAAIAGRLVAYVGVAVAAAPLVLGLPWIAATLFSREPPARFGFAVFTTATIVAVVFQASLELTQPGRLHDRYLLYALPLLFTAMAAALLSPRRLVAGTVVTGLLFAALVSRSDFFETGAELPSLSFTLHQPINDIAFSLGDRLGIADLSPGWFLAVLLVAITVLLALLLRERTKHALLIVGVPVLLFGIVETVDAFRQIRTAQYGFGFVEPRPRNWVDRSVPPGTKVGALVGQAGSPFATPVAWWYAGFWNKSVDRYFVPSGPRPNEWGQPSVQTLGTDSGGVPVDTHKWWLVPINDPRVRVTGGRPIARAGYIELRQVTPDAPLRLIR
jgi:hypothetical protein